MTWHFALVIEPAASDSSQTAFADTFTVIDPTAPALSVGELSTQRGDGIFESVGVVDGHPQEVDAHLDRLAHSAKICDLPVPHREQWRQAVIAAAEHTPRRGEGVIKLILSRGVEHGPAPTAWVTSGSAPDFALPRADGVRVVTLDRGYALDVPRRAPWLLLGAKTLSYAVNMAALREAKRRGADDAIFVTSDGFVLEAPTASLVLRVHGRFVTPAPNGGILHGTTQLSLFEHLDAQGFKTGYEVVPVSLMAEADAAWLLSSVRLAAPITSIDGEEVPVDRELTASINEYLLSPRD
ncbi:aminodeoxychorismate lyase [Microbacterium sp. NPDC076911]|uniref:aminodeoxychorismate lyase n=1 Tax=Microbacterium sp. NPDC076911 TaxID=3154958 RepID=UPI00342CC47E